MDTSKPASYRDSVGVREAIMYDGGNMQAIVDWLAASGEQGYVEECIDPADYFSPTRARILVIWFDGASAALVLHSGDWLVKCSCQFRFHALTSAEFLAANTRADVDDAQQDKPAETSDRYEIAARQLVNDIQERRRLGIGHYGNEKPRNVLYRAYQDAIDLALLLREQLTIAESITEL